MLHGMMFDPLFLLLFAVSIAISLIASAAVKSTFKKYSREKVQNGLTGAQCARKLLDYHGLHHVGVERSTRGGLSDHYDPRTDTVRLSQEVYDSASISAIGVSAHECGHAMQKNERYAPMKLRHAIVPMTNIGSNLSMPLIIAGFIFQIPPLITIGIIAFGIVVFFQLVTLPVEFNASARAMSDLRHMYILTEDEQRKARKVLTAAAMTYVAALLVALLNMLRLILMSRRRR
jgi:Zn-dependent membrane protease YugP